MSMKLHRRFSASPLVEIRLDYASPRTISNRPYIWFHEKEDGRFVTRMKAIPLSAEEATEFVAEHLDFFMEASGRSDAVAQVHEFFVGCGFDTRRTKGRGPGSKSPRVKAKPEPRVRVPKFLKKLWRLGRKPPA